MERDVRATSDGAVVDVSLDENKVADMNARPTLRRQGIGNAIFGEAETRIAAARFDEIVLERNDAALSFCRALGFEVTRHDESTELTEKPVAMLTMRKKARDSWDETLFQGTRELSAYRPRYRGKRRAAPRKPATVHRSRRG